MYSFWFSIYLYLYCRRLKAQWYSCCRWQLIISCMWSLRIRECVMCECVEYGRMNSRLGGERAQISIFQLIFMYRIRALVCVYCARQTEDTCRIHRAQIARATKSTRLFINSNKLIPRTKYTAYNEGNVIGWIKWMRANAVRGDPFQRKGQSAVGWQKIIIFF